MRKITPITKALFCRQGEQSAPVTLPHTWNAQDGQDGGGDYWRGLGIYQLELPAPTPGKQQYIEFRGANHETVVYCNGRLLGRHRGGFSTFRFELTPAMKASNNQLTVLVSNAPSDIYPQRADFTFFGGLYRDVNFIEVDGSHFDLCKSGTEGVFVTPQCNGTTRIDLYPVNGSGCVVSVLLKDAQGQTVAQAEAPAQDHTVLVLDVDPPHLWNGTADPYCYTAETTLMRGKDILDQVTVRYGYRSYHVDPNTGFWLNGKQVSLHGVSRHQDRLDKGWAISRADHEEDIRLICEIGANAIRLAHYQHDSYFYDLCDLNGLAVWAEIPFISQFLPSSEAKENTLQQMTELVLQNYNHPSILFWGISNEITIGGDSEELLCNLRELNALVKKLDPSRLTTMAQLTVVPMKSQHNYITDILSYNHYFGWYVGDVSETGPWLDRFHVMNPDRCLGVSEYGAEAILKWHSAFPDNHDYTEEYAVQYHHAMLQMFAQRPYLWSTFVWNMFDFAADDRDEGGVRGRNNKGLVTYDRKTKKDAFYLYKAYWTSAPMIHLCGARFVDRAPNERTAMVLTNCSEVTLVVNGQEYATQPSCDHCVVFENVPLQDGPNTVYAKAAGIQSNTVTWNGVSEHNYAYDLPDEGEAGNWFEDPDKVSAHKRMQYPAGFYSLRDPIGVLMRNPQTAQIVRDAMIRLGNPRALHVVNNSVGETADTMQDFYSKMRLADMLKMGGKGIPFAFKLELNEQLTTIPKEETPAH